jgi:hypothetical protein
MRRKQVLMNGLEVQWGRSGSRHVWQGLTRIQVIPNLNFWIEFSDVLDWNILQLENLHHVHSSWMGIRILWGKSVKVILDIDVGIEFANVLKTMFNARIPLVYGLNMGLFVVLLHHVVHVGVFYHPWLEEIIVVQLM